MINHFRFFFFESFRFLASFMGISLVWIYSNIPNAWWKDHNSFSIFSFLFFLFRNPNCKGTLTWYVATKWTVLTGSFGSEMVYVMFLSKDRVLVRFGLVLVFLAWKGSGCPNEGKFLSKEKALVRFGLSWHFWPKMVQVAPIKEKVWIRLNCLGAMKSLAFG